MPSLFSRSRTFSTPKKPTAEAAFDEFGRITSSPGKGGKTPSGSTSTTKKDKKSKDKGRAKGNGAPASPESPEYAVPDGSFLPLDLDPQRYEPGEEPSQERRQLLDYGYLSYRRNVVLGLEEVARLVDVVGDELGTRGLTAPFIFSTLALDVSAPAVKRLINAFLKTCSGVPQDQVDRQWREEAKFAGPHELGMCLRWGLARVVRIVGGQEVRGLLSYENYLEWSEAEAACKYQPMHFSYFIDQLNPLLSSLLVGLLTLLTRFTAHSSTTGHTPPTLSSLFGPLLFGLGPSTLAFHHVYVRYLHAATATEHLILAFIRWQDAPDRDGSTAALGLPMRLKAWIQGYPAMLPKINLQERPQPRRGARTTRVVSVRRNVRMYSADLVKTAASWGQKPRGLASSSNNRSFASSREWERICPPTIKLAPRYSDSFRKRMDLPANFHPETGTASSASTVSSPSLSSSVSTASTTSSLFDDKELGLMGMGNRTPEDRFRSLTDLKWGEFETMGFGAVGADEKKLQFDLTEGARAARAAKRATLSWQDFSSAGFTRSDAPLSDTLQFSPPVANSINAWPAQSAEMHRKLKKAQKALPAFGWDTEPVMGTEEVIEEAFLDVFCDLIYGGGWLDVERTEELDRECNWALVEYKSLPVTKATSSGTSDPRTATTLMLFEEFVPLEYRRQMLEIGSSSRRRLPSLFGTASRKQWKPATTLNGRPYVIGHVPHSPSYREVEFEGLLRSNGSVTKIISLKTQDRPRALSAVTSAMSPLSSNVASPIQLQSKPQLFLVRTTDDGVQRTSSRNSEVDSPSGRSSTPNPKRSSIFRLPVSPVSRTAGLPPAEYDTVDFEARLANIDDDNDASGSTSKRSRRHARDDAWVDILVASNSRRLGGQDAEMRDMLKGGKSDPELASQELLEVLAAVRGQLPSDDEDDDGMEPVHTDADSEDRGDSYTEATSEGDRDTLPRPQSSVDFDDESGDEGEPIITPIPQRRLGYFDLHPERRPPAQDHEDKAPVEPEPEPRTSLEDPRARFDRSSLEMSEESGYDEVYAAISPNTAKPTLSSGQDVSDDTEYYPKARTARLSANGGNVPVLAVTPPDEHAAASSGSTKQQPSKTASLIELYRERERSSQAAPAPVAPSKLPVRTGASLLPNAAARERSPRPHSPSQSSPSSAFVDSDEPLPEPPRIKEEEEDGLTTPPRYIHGAPLHNVLEEEEEGEEEV